MHPPSPRRPSTEKRRTITRPLRRPWWILVRPLARPFQLRYTVHPHPPQRRLPLLPHQSTAACRLSLPSEPPLRAPPSATPFTARNRPTSKASKASFPSRWPVPAAEYLLSAWRPARLPRRLQRPFHRWRPAQQTLCEMSSRPLAKHSHAANHGMEIHKKAFAPARRKSMKNQLELIQTNRTKRQPRAQEQGFRTFLCRAHIRLVDERRERKQSMLHVACVYDFSFSFFFLRAGRMISPICVLWSDQMESGMKLLFSLIHIGFTDATSSLLFSSSLYLYVCNENDTLMLERRQAFPTCYCDLALVTTVL